jgi:hypothetical protein
MSTLDSSIADKLADLVDWLTKKRREHPSADTPDALQMEMHQLQQKLSQAPTQPTRVAARSLELKEPIPEQQKIMDMAG